MNYIRLLSLFLIIPFLGQAQNAQNTLYLFDDFVSTPGTTGNMFMTSTSGGAVSSVTPYDNNVLGLLRLSTSTSATGTAVISTGASSLKFATGEWCTTIRLDSLSHLCSATEGYAVLIGFFDTYGAINQFDGAFFLYDSLAAMSGAASSDKWQTVTMSAGTPTFYTTTKTVATTGNTFQICVNADGTSIDFSIDGELLRTETATIPTTAATLFGLGAMIRKNAGTTARYAFIDYIIAEHRRNIQR